MDARVVLFSIALLGAAAAGHGGKGGAVVPADARAERADLVVAPDGTGDFCTIQEALDAVPEANAATKVILVRNGTYEEKVFIRSSHVALVGEDRELTRIVFPELRRNWRSAHESDRGAAVVNIGDDVTDVFIGNLTVHNSYGSLFGDHDHQFAIRSGGNATRVTLVHAAVTADGGDTLSLWNTGNGMYYHADCSFAGWVDFVCPRGWCYITGSRFFGHGLTASIWHDGSKSPDQKLVIRRSSFDGVPGFPLGRNNRDGQFFLLDVRFSARMADRPIHRPSAESTYRWPPRTYFSRCSRDGGDFAWFADNLAEAEGAPRARDVDARWTFQGMWDPEGTMPAALPFASVPRPENGDREARTRGTVLRWAGARNATRYRVRFGTTSPPPSRGEAVAASWDPGPLAPGTTYRWRVDAVTPSGVVDGPEWSFATGPETGLPRIRIVLAGDSTVTDEAGWGTGLRAHLNERAECVNMARNGRSSKSFRDEGHWTAALRKKPDYLLIQFGHNDQPGKGPERETDPGTSYRENLARYVDEARTAGATPVLVTSLARRRFGADGRVSSDLTEYAAAARAVAAAKDVPLVDLHARGVQLLDRIGPDAATELGIRKEDGTLDRTHLSPKGSAVFGALVANELRRAVPRLAPYLH